MSEMASAVITINHPLGLHMRIGKDVVLVAEQFAATITAQNLTRPSPIVNARSILQLMQLQARQGHRIQLEAEGPDAAGALDALRVLLEAPPVAPPNAPPAQDGAPTP